MLSTRFCAQPLAGTGLVELLVLVPALKNFSLDWRALGRQVLRKPSEAMDGRSKPRGDAFTACFRSTCLPKALLRITRLKMLKALLRKLQ